MRSKLSIKIILFFTLLLVGNTCFTADFLPPDEAFRFEHKQEGSQMELSWTIAEGYYLYRDRIYAGFETEQESLDLPVTFNSESHTKEDKNFGVVQVFHDSLMASVDLSTLATQNLEGQFFVEYQGCSSKGLCYQPQYREIPVELASLDTGSANTGGNGKLHASTGNEAPPALVPANPKRQLDNASGIAAFLQDASLFKTMMIFLLLGIGLSLTPCVLPMVPIISGIIVGQGEGLTAMRGFLLSFFYVIGMSVTYALAGVAAASFGASGNLQMYMQNPWVLGSFSAVFVALAFAMFGYYNLALPSGLQQKLNSISDKQESGKFLGVAIMGALSALVVSPCVSAPLAGALIYISSTGDKLLGGTALFALGIGMGFPLMAIGAGGGKLVPRAGMWMDHVKHLFGVILLGVAIWLISRVIPGSLAMMLWALLFIFYGLYNGGLSFAEMAGDSQGGGQRIIRSTGFIMVLYGSALFYGSLAGNESLLHPLEPARQYMPSANTGETTMTANHARLFKRVATLQELQGEIESAAAGNQTVLLDFYADWCTSCLEMEKYVFSTADVQEKLAPVRLLQIDVTLNNKANRAILDNFGLFGPPAILFFDTRGKEMQEMRILGEMGHDEFLGHIQQLEQAVDK